LPAAHPPPSTTRVTRITRSRDQQINRFRVSNRRGV
jgi:hypothetical protein